MNDTPITDGFSAKPHTQREWIIFAASIEDAAREMMAAGLQMSVDGWGAQMGYTLFQQSCARFQALELQHNPHYIPLPPRLTKPPQ